MCRWLILTLVLFFAVRTGKAQDVYKLVSGQVSFFSEAPQELIKASSTQMEGIIDVRKRTFFFRVPIQSFVGFNSPLQNEHFNENYMETRKYPEATYSGKIIEDISLMEDGVHDIRVKGKLNIHGLHQERIVNAHVIIKDQVITIDAAFMVSLADHDIKIPRVVYDKLAPDISVSVNARMALKR